MGLSATITEGGLWWSSRLSHLRGWSLRGPILGGCASGARARREPLFDGAAMRLQLVSGRRLRACAAGSADDSAMLVATSS